MNIAYNGKRSIAVIELSSTAIKTLVGQPKAFIKKPNELGRFKRKIFPFFLIDYIDNNQKLDITSYQKIALPEIKKTIKWVLGMNLQAFKIVITGYYRNIVNTNEFIDLLYEALKEAKKHNTFTPEILTPSRESQLSFQSWLHTTQPIPQDERTNDMFFFLNNGLNLDVGGGTTEVTLIKNMSFEDTISLPYGADILRTNILNTNFNDLRHFIGFTQNLENQLRQEISHILLQNFPIPTKLEYCICSGSNVIVQGGDEYNNRIKADIGSLEWELSEYKSMLDKVIYPYLESKTPIPDRHLKYLMRYCAFVIFRTVAYHFKIKDYYSNYANLRIGVFYEIIDELNKGV